MTKQTKGIITKATYGTDEENELTLELEIQSFEGWQCTMIFKKESNIKAIFNEFKSDYNTISNTQTLLHQKCYLAESKGTQVPPAIAKLPIPKYYWIYNDNAKYI